MNSKDLQLSELLNLSMELWEKNKNKWSPMEPEYGKIFILWMMEEIGEVIQIIKKKEEFEIMNNETVRLQFIEELCDVLMYYIDILNRFSITPEEFSNIYLNKFNKNLNRNYEEEYKNK